ncbi:MULTISPECIES: glycerol-3-phosphate 1-O-acyltransferase PlsY [Rhodomicrobium]|uniref:glycerol-3-phosphate 1-O-acyltransferase PlsY n=1 Tax=Rhodomicrobium TaxID=1068 RepID=UPI000B4B23F2|nr:MULTISPECIES: glycerol-3-phosphate 1-O-acyltransferase PlsY [Rhodomicrobium]
MVTNAAAILGGPADIALALLFGYALGSIPFGLILTRLAGAGDIRAIGSGNIGATNVLRTGRKGLAALTLLGDFAKGLAAVLIASEAGPELGAVAGLGAFLGHLFPVWLRFKGGKGVATYIGVLAGIAPWVAVAFCAIWLGVAWISRYSSLSALTAAAATPLILLGLGKWLAVGLFTVLTILVFIRHHANISRLMSGGESKIGGGKG